MMPQFRKQPLLVEAEQWLGWTVERQQETRLGLRTHPTNLVFARLETYEDGGCDVVPTDWIVTETTGERVKVSDALFRATYDPVGILAKRALEETAP